MSEPTMEPIQGYTNSLLAEISSLRAEVERLRADNARYHVDGRGHPTLAWDLTDAAVANGFDWTKDETVENTIREFTRILKEALSNNADHVVEVRSRPLLTGDQIGRLVERIFDELNDVGGYGLAGSLLIDRAIREFVAGEGR